MPKRQKTNRFVSIQNKSPLELLRGRNKTGIGTSFVGASPYGGLSSSVSNSAELDEAESFLLQPSSKPTVCDDGVPNTENHIPKVENMLYMERKLEDALKVQW